MGVLDSSRDITQVENNTPGGFYDSLAGRRQILSFNLWLQKRLLTIDIEAFLVQGEEAQLGDTMGLMAQLPVQLLPV